MRVDWPSHSSMSLADAASMVAIGGRIALTLMEPHLMNRPGVRNLPLLHFPRVKVGVICLGAPSPLAKRFIATMRKHVKTVWPLGRSTGSTQPIAGKGNA